MNKMGIFWVMVNTTSSSINTLGEYLGWNADAKLINFIYHTNYRVIRGFPALRKAVTTQVKKCCIFFTCVWYRQSSADTSLPLRATRPDIRVNDGAFTILNLRSFALSEFFQIMAAKTSLTDSNVQTLLKGEKNQNMERKTENYVFSRFGNGISRA